MTEIVACRMDLIDKIWIHLWSMNHTHLHLFKIGLGILCCPGFNPSSKCEHCWTSFSSSASIWELKLIVTLKIFLPRVHRPCWNSAGPFKRLAWSSWRVTSAKFCFHQIQSNELVGQKSCDRKSHLSAASGKFKLWPTHSQCSAPK